MDTNIVQIIKHEIYTLFAVNQRACGYKIKINGIIHTYEQNNYGFAIKQST